MPAYLLHGFLLLTLRTASVLGLSCRVAPSLCLFVSHLSATTTSSVRAVSRRCPSHLCLCLLFPSPSPSYVVCLRLHVLRSNDMSPCAIDSHFSPRSKHYLFQEAREALLPRFLISSAFYRCLHRVRGSHQAGLDTAQTVLFASSHSILRITPPTTQGSSSVWSPLRLLTSAWTTYYVEFAASEASKLRSGSAQNALQSCGGPWPPLRFRLPTALKAAYLSSETTLCSDLYIMHLSTLPSRYLLPPAYHIHPN
ncbi:hypothetical protein BV25DRAFT_708521 [Artomyces pyxidatus]|uniref:Uncharacterized protein n=1 Tax=Artomyces pyxidatus TaxID=48021 RepID=A0ACB8SZE9_9AGAM|nr:hypothetical protein BV25DRAFT_708521 [Artomyces pyxidatus]